MYTPYRMLVMAICAFLVFQPLQAHDWSGQRQTWGRTTALVPLFALALVAMLAQSFNPFLYFQF